MLMINAFILSFEVFPISSSVIYLDLNVVSLF